MKYSKKDMSDICSAASLLPGKFFGFFVDWCFFGFWVFFEVIDLLKCQIHRIPEETSSGMSLSVCFVLASVTATKYVGSSEDS